MGSHWDWSLIGFLTGTYLIAPVFGFGSALAILGAAHAGSPHRETLFLDMLAVLDVYNVFFFVLS